MGLGRKRIDATSRRTVRQRASTVLAWVAVVFLGAGVVMGSPAPGGAVDGSGGNFVATGHDMDLHCAGGQTDECDYFKILVDKVRAGSTLPILALDQGTELTDALTLIGASPVQSVDPSDAATFNAVAFVDGSGNKLYSAIITASDSTCGGCDNDTTGESNINARANDFKTYFNAGGGIIALAGAENRDTYYNDVPLSGLAAAAVAPPFTVTPDGTALGITSQMANCCITHNSFSPPSSPFVILETDDSSNAETIAVFGGRIGGGGFETTTTTTTTTTTPTSSTTSTSTTTTSTTTTSTTTTSTTTSTSTTTTAPPPECKPGYGYGDKNHCHSGPPGQNKKEERPPTKPAASNDGVSSRYVLLGTGVVLMLLALVVRGRPQRGES